MTHVCHFYQLRVYSARRWISSHFRGLNQQKNTKKWPTRTKWQKLTFCLPGNPRIFRFGTWKRSMLRNSLKVCVWINPLDATFNTCLISAIGFEGARYTRVAGVPERGEKKKFLTRSIWMNNNKLKNLKNMDQLANSVLEYPEQLSWIDFSFNYITEIDEVGNYV